MSVLDLFRDLVWVVKETFSWREKLLAGVARGLLKSRVALNLLISLLLRQLAQEQPRPGISPFGLSVH